MKISQAAKIWIDYHVTKSKKNGNENWKYGQHLFAPT